jgi:hypothetical protein
MGIMRRPRRGFCPHVERFEGRQLLSVATATGHARAADLPGALAAHRAETSGDHGPDTAVARARSGAFTGGTPMASAGKGRHSARFVLSRITNTAAGNAVNLVPPFQQVLVQAKPPVPGRTYNVLSVAVRNHTSQTFTAQDNSSVKLSGQTRATPILTGDEQWKPGQFIVFYVLTHQYYPAQPEVSGGFVFDLDGSRGVAIPGPSGIFLRLTYRPATFARTLDWIVAYGPGAEGGLGPRYGLPDTAIWEFQH